MGQPQQNNVNFKHIVLCVFNFRIKNYIKRDLILYVGWPWQSEALLPTDTLYQSSHN